MALVEILLATLCLNSTCTDQETKYDYSTVQYLYDDEQELSNYLINKTRSMDQLEADLKKENLVVTTIQNAELSGIDDKKGGTGVSFDLLNILKERYEFNYTVIAPPSNEIGDATNGAVSLLANGKADLLMAFLPVIYQYTEYIQYSPSLDTGEWVVLMKRPPVYANGTGLLAPFSVPVWALILVSLLLVGPIIYAIIYIQTKVCKFDEDQVYSLDSCMWFVYGALLKQGTNLNPSRDSARVLFASWWIFITILTAFYTANLTAYLTLSKITLPISEAKEIGSKNWKWVTTKGNAIETILDLARKDEAMINNNKNNNEEDIDETEFVRISNVLGAKSRFSDFSDDRILEEYIYIQNGMFVREKPIVEYVMYEEYKRKREEGAPEDDRCRFVLGQFSAMTYPRAIAYKNGFTYSELFDDAIRHLVETGVVSYKLRENLPNTPICPINLGHKQRRLSNSDLIVTYMIVGGGFFVSLCIFVIEYLIQYYRDRTSLTTFVTKQKIDKNVSKHGPNNNQFKKINNNIITFNSNFTPPPAYHTIYNTSFAKNSNNVKKSINGRDYWVVNSNNKDDNNPPVLIPTRAPSALLFQHLY